MMKIHVKICAAFLVVLLLLPFGLCGCSSRYETVMEYNGMKLTEDMYFYWLSTFKRNILTAFDDAKDTDAFWQSSFDEERTVEEYFTEVIQTQIRNYLIAQDLYKKNRLTLDASVKAWIKDDIDEKIEYYGSRGNLNEVLADLMLNVDSLEDVYTWEKKYDAVYDHYFGKGGSLEVSDQDLISYYEQNYSRIQYIVFYTTNLETDAEGNQISTEMTEEQLAAKMAKIEECQSKIDAGDDFGELMNKYSEYDTSKYPNGFFVSVNEMDIWGADICSAVKDAKVGEVCRIEEEFAVFFVKKYSLTSFENLDELDIEQLSGLSSYAGTAIRDAFFAELAKNVTVNQDVISKYKLSEIKANPHYSI